ncbi:MAG: sulfite exporter TauE/SafE family protein [Candidatus Woesearchaeota archaeon]
MINELLFFLLSTLFGIISMSFGIGVAPMFLPFLVIVMNFPFGAAIAVTLLIEIVGFSAALLSFIRQRLVAYRLAAQTLVNTVPAAVVGVIVSTLITTSTSVIIFSSVLLIMAVLIFHPEHEVLYRFDDPSSGYVSSQFGLARSISIFSGTTSGLLAGLTGTGVGEVNNYVFLKKYRMPGDMAAATSMFIIAITALVVASSHLAHLWFTDSALVLSLKKFFFLGASGMLAGVLVASRFRASLPTHVRERYVASLLFALGIVSFLTLIV